MLFTLEFSVEYSFDPVYRMTQ